MYIFIYDTGSTDINHVHIQICVYVYDINIQICVNGYDMDGQMCAYIYTCMPRVAQIRNIQICLYVYDIDLHVCVCRCTCMWR